MELVRCHTASLPPPHHTASRPASQRPPSPPRLPAPPASPPAAAPHRKPPRLPAAAVAAPRPGAARPGPPPGAARLASRRSSARPASRFRFQKSELHHQGGCFQDQIQKLATETDLSVGPRQLTWLTMERHSDIEDMSYNLLTGCYHHVFIQEFRYPVLPEQQHGKKPARWIHIHLVADKEGKQMRTTLVIRGDNVYLIGFINQSGQWYEFGYTKRSKHMLEPPKPKLEPTFLECDDGYNSIFGKRTGGAKELLTVQLGRDAAIEAVSRLSGYPGTQAPGGCAGADRDTKMALACLILTICEAARLSPPHKTVMDGWSGGCKIDKEQVKYVKKWGDMSRLLLKWRRSGYMMNTNSSAVGGSPGSPWQQQQRDAAGEPGPSQQQQPLGGKRTQQQPLGGKRTQQPPPPPLPRNGSGRNHPQHQETAVVPPGEADDCEGHGRPLVEVFAVRAGFHFLGTIAAFDGRRGQIIYDSSSNDFKQAPGAAPAPLLLTGPYRAITAYGSFTIEVEITGPDTPDASTDTGELTWNCYDGQNTYDEPVTGRITTRSGQVEVTYAVLRDAMEANVEVRLLLPEATAESRVYGRIATRSRAFSGTNEDKAWCVLFDSQSEGVPLIADGSASMPRLPLARSVISLPLGKPLEIDATLYDEPLSPGGEGVRHPFFQYQEDLEVTVDDQSWTRPLTTGKQDGKIEVRITSPDLDPPADAAGPGDTGTAPPLESCSSAASSTRPDPPGKE